MKTSVIPSEIPRASDPFIGRARKICGIELQPYTLFREDVWRGVLSAFCAPIVPPELRTRIETERHRKTEAMETSQQFTPDESIDRDWRACKRRDIGSGITSWLFLFLLTAPESELLFETENFDALFSKFLSWRSHLAASAADAENLANEILDEAERWRVQLRESDDNPKI